MFRKLLRCLLAGALTLGTPLGCLDESYFKNNVQFVARDKRLQKATENAVARINNATGLVPRESNWFVRTIPIILVPCSKEHFGLSTLYSHDISISISMCDDRTLEFMENVIIHEIIHVLNYLNSSDRKCYQSHIDKPDLMMSRKLFKNQDVKLDIDSLRFLCEHAECKRMVPEE